MSRIGAWIRRTVTWGSAALVAGLLVAAPQAAAGTPTCFGRTATIVGTG